uniref:Uncharacterized protein n=1 Tax=viral metagenome TaxID=1070528 RepID=A0A6M3LRM8_9ZZZZ
MSPEERVLLAIKDEHSRAASAFGALHSAHEGYAVIKEELDELWEEVKKKTQDRDCTKMEKEAVQIASMALRFVLDVCMDDQGQYY